ncbi:conserved hypothetical protein [Streptomyces sviceus ATCC 29083]|uniref:Tetratricopeptide repeat protein n=1 Tax=Streptomyces sviceus (strain ATCC 29083 / DSM 924 / JCM 4929 / NBRC 13980 / NCIMB 11184 / NRRL 5439 / UC 5370) TaxID=463191 RepID=B5HNX0_STRX2|nr:conserved hypothetical protein [Streptomyces sviceus ATCC 29083]
MRSAPYAYHLGMIERASQRYAPARRHLREALQINPYFSPSGVRAAREALAALGDVPDEGLPEEGGADEGGTAADGAAADGAAADAKAVTPRPYR